MYTWDSSVNVTCSIFTNNSAANHGGILDTPDSSLIILSAVRLHSYNSAAYQSGVMYVHINFDSSLNITSSTFSNNCYSAVYNGGVMTTVKLSFNIYQ